MSTNHKATGLPASKWLSIQLFPQSIDSCTVRRDRQRRKVTIRLSARRLITSSTCSTLPCFIRPAYSRRHPGGRSSILQGVAFVEESLLALDAWAMVFVCNAALARCYFHVW